MRAIDLSLEPIPSSFLATSRAWSELSSKSDEEDRSVESATSIIIGVPYNQNNIASRTRSMTRADKFATPRKTMGRHISFNGSKRMIFRTLFDFLREDVGTSNCTRKNPRAKQLNKFCADYDQPFFIFDMPRTMWAANGFSTSSGGSSGNITI